MNDKTIMYNGIGVAIMIFAMCLGIGSCMRLELQGQAELEKVRNDIKLEEK